MKAYRLHQAGVSILLLAVLLFGFISVQSARATGSSWTSIDPMATVRANHTATVLTNGKVLVAGGGNLSAELYDPDTGHWTPTGSLKYARSYHTATLLTNGKVLVVGGLGDGSYYPELYDPDAAGGTWTVTESLHTGRYFHTATLLSNGQVLVVGGLGGSPLSLLASAELYDPTTGLWTVTGSLNTGRDLHTATLLPNGQVLVAGGQGSSGYLTSAELYDPTTGTWTNTGSLATPRKYHTATLLSNDKVLVVGGFNNISGDLASAELYDPTPPGTWSGTGPLPNPRAYHTATLLAKGKVLVVGGQGVDAHSNTIILSSAELYDPTPGTWSDTGPLNDARRDHTVVQLFNDLVLAAGGFNGSYLSSAELYDPEPPTTPPNVPVTVSPNGDTNTQPSYIWHYSGGATSYHLTVYSTSTSSTVINNVVVNTSFCSGGLCTYHPLITLPVGNYEFKVSASNSFGTSADSAWRTFNVLGNLNISGKVGSVDGVTLTYFDIKLKTATTNGSGDYSFDVSYNWTGTITPSKPGYTFAPTDVTVSTPITSNLPGQDFIATPITYTISGNAGAAGATLNYTDDTPKTATADGLGHYSFNVSYNWSGTVTPFLIGYVFTPLSKNYTDVLADQPLQNYSAAAANFTISGNAGVGGATLSYTDGPPKTATADGLGHYSFDVRAGWIGTITPSYTGYNFTPTSINVSTPVAADLPGQDFTAARDLHKIYLPLVIR